MSGIDSWLATTQRARGQRPVAAVPAVSMHVGTLQGTPTRESICEVVTKHLL